MLTPPLLLADYAGYVDASDRSEIRARTTQQLGNAGQQVAGNGLGFGVDAYTQPQLRVRMTNRVFEYTFAYMPSVTVTDLQLGSGAEAQFLQTGHVGVAWRADRNVTIAVNEDATYGQYNSANVLPAGAGAVAAGATANPMPQAPAPAAGAAPAPAAPITGANLPPLQAAPAPKTITLVASRTGAEVGVQTDRQTHFAFRAGYLATGGIGNDSTAQLPLQFGPSAVATMSYALSRRDFAITTAGASSTQFTSLACIGVPGAATGAGLCRPVYQIVQFNQGFQHAIERNTAVTAQAGVSYVRTRPDDGQPFTPVWFPTGLLSVVHREGPKGGILTELDLQLVPVINPLTGTLANFIQGQGLLTEPIAQRVMLRAAAGAAQAIPTDGPAAATIVQGGLEVAVQLGKQVDLALGGRAYWQRQAQLPAAGANAADPQALAFVDFFTTVAYFAVTVRAPELRF